MHITTVYTLLLHWMCCELCLAIKVPIAWNDDSVSEVTTNNEDFSIDQFQPQNLVPNVTPVKSKPIPVEYFQYTAKKPQFAVDLAAFHGVQSPENHYSSYSIKPYTEVTKPNLGKHQIFNSENSFYEPFQKYKEQENLLKPVAAHETSYEVFHPYKAEEPGLQEIYKDPVLFKIRNDLKNAKERLQNYEKEAGKIDISKDEYSESAETTDRKKLPQKNIPSEFEIHRPLRRPIYYRAPVNYNPRHHYLNQRFRHPLNQNYIKVRPMHYLPLRNHLQSLRQHHSLKYDDEQNEYPHVAPAQNFANPPEGYDIYEKGKANYEKLRNNVDESINSQVKENRPVVNGRLELQNDETSDDEESNDKEFIPVKNYAQVRKTETARYLPREAAFEEATNLDEIQNAPRLREAVKSTKAQIVYSEEGYEDSAYDHAGEQKHASDHEGHGGYLVEKELSGGKYKIPSLSAAYEDARGSVESDKVLHGEKWKNNNKDTNEEDASEDYTDDDHEKIIASDIYQDNKDLDDQQDTTERDKREDKETSEQDKAENEAEDYADDYDKINNASNVNDDRTDLDYNDEKTKRDESKETFLNDTGEHDLNKREANFKVPEINLNDTFLTEKELLEQAKEKIMETNNRDIKHKYPYYFQNLQHVNKLSPLRYAENLKFIPKKTKGGTEFYDSRNRLLECPEVEDIDPIPDKIKNNTTENNETASKHRKKRQADFDQVKEQPRLKSLGDKIDCFKAKYFGENPLDSPFFKEELVLKPEPVELPNLPSYKLKTKFDLPSQASKFNDVTHLSEKLNEDNKKDILSLFEKLNQKSNFFSTTNNISEKNVLNDNINYLNQEPTFPDEISLTSKTNDQFTANSGTDINTEIPLLRRKRRSQYFFYEPYKVVRDNQVQESKKTITTNNVIPLIRQLQSTAKSNQTQNIGQYKVIGREDRTKIIEENEENSSEKGPTFVNVSFDMRRGEPRYEIEPVNHKARYSPVSNEKSMSMEDYVTRTKAADTDNNTLAEQSVNIDTTSQNSDDEIITERIFFDVSKFLPAIHSSANKSYRRVIRTSTPSSNTGTRRSERAEMHNKQRRQSTEQENSEELSDAKETKYEPTTKKPRRRKIRVMSTIPPETIDEDEQNIQNQPAKLRLITRFRDEPVNNSKKQSHRHEKESEESLNQNKSLTQTPKYNEKSKKTSKSTLVTDSKRYGDENDDMRVDEIDAMIGVQQDMNEYKPLYEKEIKEKKQNDVQATAQNTESSESSDSAEEDNESTEDENNQSGSDEDYSDSSEDDDDDDREVEVDKDDSEEENDDEDEKSERQSDMKNDEEVASTTKVQNTNLQVQPTILKKKIEIHKDLPFNKSAPHVTQYKEDIKEVEIIKEYPKKKTGHRQDTLNLYKDKNLAKEVNKLGDVEVFKQNLDIVAGPKHGGNYRSARITDLKENKNIKRHGGNLRLDAEPSQSKDIQKVESDENIPSQRNRQRLSLRNSKDRENSRKNEELIDLRESEIEVGPLHGGNYRSYKDNSADRSNFKRKRNKNLNNQNNNEHENREANEKNLDIVAGNKHGGNYRSARITDQKENKNLKRHGGNLRVDAEPSQTKDIQKVESDENIPSQRKRQRVSLIKNKDRENSRKNEELINLRESEIEVGPLHGGNYRSLKDNSADRSNLEIIRNKNLHNQNSNKHENREAPNEKTQLRNSHNGHSNIAFVKNDDTEISARSQNYDDGGSYETSSENILKPHSEDHKKIESNNNNNYRNPRFQNSERYVQVSDSEPQAIKIKEPSRKKQTNRLKTNQDLSRNDQKRDDKNEEKSNTNAPKNIEYYIPPKFKNAGREDDIATYNLYENAHDGSEINDDNPTVTEEPTTDIIKSFIPSKFLNSAKYSESDKGSTGNTADNNSKENLSQEDNQKHLKAKSERSRSSRNDPAVVLNTFAQAVPILTTTPSYILDPSKRKYYYVDE